MLLDGPHKPRPLALLRRAFRLLHRTGSIWGYIHLAHFSRLLIASDCQELGRHRAISFEGVLPFMVLQPGPALCCLQCCARFTWLILWSQCFMLKLLFWSACVLGRKWCLLACLVVACRLMGAVDAWPALEFGIRNGCGDSVSC